LTILGLKEVRDLLVELSNALYKGEHSAGGLVETLTDFIGRWETGTLEIPAPSVQVSACNLPSTHYPLTASSPCNLPSANYPLSASSLPYNLPSTHYPLIAPLPYNSPSENYPSSASSPYSANYQSTASSPHPYANNSDQHPGYIHVSCRSSVLFFQEITHKQNSPIMPPVHRLDDAIAPNLLPGIPESGNYCSQCKTRSVTCVREGLGACVDCKRLHQKCSLLSEGRKSRDRLSQPLVLRKAIAAGVCKFHANLESALLI